MAAGILPFALPGIVESTNKVGTGIVSSIDNWGLDKDKFGFARSQAALDRVRAQQEYLGQLRASGQSDWQSALQNVANSSNQNAQFNANSNALALGDVQMQAYLRTLQAQLDSRNSQGATRDLRQTASASNFFSEQIKATSGAQGEALFTDNLQRSRAQAVQGLQQSRDAFDQLYSFKEADKTSELKLAGQRYRFNEKDKTAELKLADQALRLGESNLSAVASKNKFTSLIYNKLIGSLGLKDLADQDRSASSEERHPTPKHHKVKPSIMASAGGQHQPHNTVPSKVVQPSTPVVQQTPINPSTTKLASRIRPTAPSSNAKADGGTFYNGAYHQGYYPGLGPPPGISSEQPITAPKPSAPKASKPSTTKPNTKPTRKPRVNAPAILINPSKHIPRAPHAPPVKRPAIHAAGSSMAKKPKPMPTQPTPIPDEQWYNGILL